MESPIYVDSPFSMLNLAAFLIFMRQPLPPDALLLKINKIVVIM